MHFRACISLRCSSVVLMKSRDLFHKHASRPGGSVLGSRPERAGSVDQGHVFHRSAQDQAPSLGRCVPRGGLALEHADVPVSLSLSLFLNYTSEADHILLGSGLITSAQSWRRSLSVGMSSSVRPFLAPAQPMR